MASSRSSGSPPKGLRFCFIARPASVPTEAAPSLAATTGKRYPTVTSAYPSEVKVTAKKKAARMASGTPGVRRLPFEDPREETFVDTRRIPKITPVRASRTFRERLTFRMKTAMRTEKMGNELTVGETTERWPFWYPRYMNKNEMKVETAMRARRAPSEYEGCLGIPRSRAGIMAKAP